MTKKFLILIEDDFEIMGNGLGNVAELQYLPALTLMNISKKHNIKLTFMVDVAHQLALKKYIWDSGIRIQKKLWEDTILLMKEKGFDVQLHLHPQWIDAKYKDGFFFLSDKWNIGCYDPDEQQQIITESIIYLESLIKPQYPDYHVCAFKAGSWGLQPSANLLVHLRDNGIKIVMGVRNGLIIPNINVDYSELEEKYLPYYPDFNNITKVSKDDTGLVVTPLQPFAPDILTLAKLILNHLRNSIVRKNKLSNFNDGGIPPEILKLAHVAEKNLYTFSLFPYQTHLKIGNQPFSYLKSSFDTVIHKLQNFPQERIPILIESHTKQHIENHYHIEKFFGYICEKYDSVIEFSDMTNYAREIIENPNLIHIRTTNE